MNEKTKKILAVILFVAIVVTVGAALYFVFFAPEKAPEPTVLEEGVPVGVLPEAQEGAPIGIEEPGAAIGEILLPEAAEVAAGGRTQVTTLTTSEVLSTTLSADGQGVNYYDPATGKFYKINEDGTVSELSPAQFPEVEDVSWSKGGNKAVLEFPDGSNIVYNFDSGVQVTLPKHWEDFEFSPATDDILAKSIGLDPGNRALVISNDDGSQVQAVAALGDNADKVMITPSPQDEVIAFSDTSVQSIGFGRTRIIPIGQNEENFKALIVEGYDFLPLWSPNGDHLLYSASGEYSNYEPLLWIVNGTANNIGDNRQSLGLKTWADKCTFATNNIAYCAVPQSLPPSVGLNREFAYGLPDDLYQVDLVTGRSVRVAIPEEDVSMEQLTVSSDGSMLYFRNASTGLLQTIRLK